MERSWIKLNNFASSNGIIYFPQHLFLLNLVKWGILCTINNWANIYSPASVSLMRLGLRQCAHRYFIDHLMRSALKKLARIRLLLCNLIKPLSSKQTRLVVFNQFCFRIQDEYQNCTNKTSSKLHWSFISCKGYLFSDSINTQLHGDLGSQPTKITEKTLLKSQDPCPLTKESSEIKKLQQADVNKLNFVLPSSDITEIHLNMCNP